MSARHARTLTASEPHYEIRAVVVARRRREYLRMGALARSLLASTLWPLSR